MFGFSAPASYRYSYRIGKRLKVLGVALLFIIRTQWNYERYGGREKIRERRWEEERERHAQLTKRSSKLLIATFIPHCFVKVLYIRSSKILIEL